MLVVIDVFTRYVWISPLHNKTSASVLHALEKCFKVIGPPCKVRSDSGKEFRANQVQRYLKSMDVKHFVTQGESKNNYVERVIKTFRSLMHRYMKRKRSFRYIDSIEAIVENYNKKPHSSLGNTAPIEINEDNEVDQIVSLYLTLPVAKKKKKINKRKMKKKSPFRFKIRDNVRISHLKHTFEREFMEKYTGEIFKIKLRFIKQNIPMYKLQDLNEEELVGSFYQAELQKVEKPEETLWEVEKIVSKRRRNKKNMVLVKWLNFPSSFNSWIPESDLRDLS